LEKIIPDDTLYGYSIARHIALGQGITYNGIDKTNGFQPLWIFLITPVFLFTKDIYLAINIILTFQAVLDAIVVFLIYKLAQELFDYKVGLLSSLFWAINPLIIFQTMNGIEVTLYIMFILATLGYYNKIRNNLTIKNTVLLGLLIGLTFLARGDGIFLYFILAFHILFWKRKFKSFLIFSIVSLLIVSPFFIWSFFTFGTIQESSQALKYYLSHGYFRPEGPISTVPEITIAIKEDMIRGLGALAQQMGIIDFNINIITTVLAAFFGICLIFSLKLWKKISIPIVFGILLFLFYTIYMWGVQIRYMTPIVPFLTILVFVGYYKINSDTKKFLVNILLLVFVFIIIIYNGFVQWDREYFPQQRETYKDVMWLKENTPKDAVVGSFFSGIPLYFSDRTVINLEGILDFNAQKAILNRSVYSYMKSRNVSIWLDSTYHCYDNCNSACYGNCTPPFYAKDEETLERWHRGEIDILKEHDYVAVIEPEANFELIRNRCQIYNNLRGYKMMGCFFIIKVK